VLSLTLLSVLVMVFLVIKVVLTVRFGFAFEG
jgi:hypothetical protein